MNNRPPFTHLVQDLPQTMSFIDPGTLERHSGRALKLRLGANESSFGISPYTKEAMQEAVECLTLYADPQSYDLRAKLASIHGITMKNLVVGSGIDDLIGLVTQVAGYKSPSSLHVEIDAIANNKLCGCARHNQH